MGRSRHVVRSAMESGDTTEVFLCFVLCRTGDMGRRCLLETADAEAHHTNIETDKERGRGRETERREKERTAEGG